MFCKGLVKLVVFGLMMMVSAAPLVALDIEETATDYSCPEGYTLVSPDEARANVEALCPGLGTWDIVRLEGGGSMDGPGYGCNVRNLDQRALGGSLCVELETTVVEGDSTCPCGYTLVTAAAASANQSDICSLLGAWWIARLEDGSSISGSVYSCAVLSENPYPLGASVCRETLP